MVVTTISADIFYIEELQAAEKTKKASIIYCHRHYVSKFTKTENHTFFNIQMAVVATLVVITD